MALGSLIGRYPTSIEDEPRAVVHGYLDGELSRKEAYKVLRNHPTTFARLMAGRVALEGAIANLDPDWFSSAQYYIERAAKDPLSRFNRWAGAILTQMPIYENLIKKSALPNETLARQVYADTVNYASKILIDKKGVNIQRRNPHEGGLSHVLATLILCQRFSLSEFGGSETWFATLSQLSETRTIGRPDLSGWDINGYTAYGDPSYPNLTYKIRVRVSNEADTDRSNAPMSDQAKFVTVYPYPDLAISKYEPQVVKRIILEAHEELHYPPSHNSQLDQRENKLLDIIG
jgi:hypothetical protein